MSIIAVAVRHLMAAGVTGEALVAAIAAMEAESPATDTRSTGAKRQQRYRERVAERNEASQSVTSDVIVTPSPFPAPPNENNLTPPTHTPGKQSRTRKGTRISESWQPEALDAETELMVRRWPNGSIEREMAKFRDFWAAKAGAGGTKLDWQATWRNWLRSADERIPRNGSGQRFGNTHSGSRAIDAGHGFIEDGRHH